VRYSINRFDCTLFENSDLIETVASQERNPCFSCFLGLLLCVG
jgi:hypothetical protein